MSWTILNEYGIEYPPQPPARPDPPLAFPSLIERRNGGGRLIVDILSFPKVLTIGVECRTLRVGPDGEILYDSIAKDIGDGYGCSMDDGLTAIMRRSTWEILIVSDDGRVQDRIGLWNFSKRMPRVLSWTPRKTFLIAFVDRVHEVDVIEVDRRGRLLWYLPAGEARIGNPASVQLLDNENFLVADDFSHVAMEVSRDAKPVWRYGATKDPGDRIDRLSSPGSIRQSGDGRRVIADTRNHRILVIATDGRVQHIAPVDTQLCSPTFAELLPDGHMLISDAGNSRVLELDRDRRIVWQYGNLAPAKRSLSFPRTVEPAIGGGILVADTANNRVVEMKDGVTQECPFDDATPLFWPRCARRLSGGNLLIADGRNGRVIEVSRSGKILKTLNALDLAQYPKLKDPHDVSLVPDGRLLVVDPFIDLVIITDWSGHVSWAAGIEGTIKVKDPHSAQFTQDETVLICDSGNHRLIYVDKDGKIVRSVGSFAAGLQCIRLNRPRHAQVGPDGALVVVDTGNNRIICADQRGQVLWSFNGSPASPIYDLDQPRWAHLINRNEVLVCDHYHHRILHLRHKPDEISP